MLPREMAGIFKSSTRIQHVPSLIVTSLIFITLFRMSGRMRENTTTPECKTTVVQVAPPRKRHLWTDLMEYPRFNFDPNFKNPCWFENNQLKCLPYMFIFGIKKCGTSDFMKRLAKHPDFVNPGFREAQWFARRRFENTTSDDISFYIDMFKEAAQIIKKDSLTRADGTLVNPRQITGEKSPSNVHINSHWRELPGNENLDEPRYVNIDFIHHFLPNIKILIIFRNPVDRLYSDYHHEYGTLMPDNTPSREQFHSIVKKGLALYNECFKHRSVRSCVYEPSIYEQTKMNIQLGIYYVYWQDILRLYSRDQIFILKTERLRHFSNEYMNSVYKFLEISTLSDKEFDKYGISFSKDKPSARWGPMLDETADMLYKFYDPFNKIMADLTGDKEFLYRRK